MKPIVLLFTLALTGCGGGSSSDESPTNSSNLGKSKNGFYLVTSNYLLTNCPVATASTNGWYKCLKGTSFTGYVDLFDKKYCEIAVGNDGEFHYITDTEHLTTVNAATYLQNNSETGVYSLNSSDVLGPNLIAIMSSNFDYTSKFSDFSISLVAISNRYYSIMNNGVLYSSEITIYQKSGATTMTKSRECYINSLD